MPPMVEERKPWICEDCSLKEPPLFALQDELWQSIAKKKEWLCFRCAELRLKRPITWWDLKPSGLSQEFVLGVRIFLQSTIKEQIQMLEEGLERYAD